MKLYELSHVGSQTVDRESGVIRGVKILGATSKNGRTYSPKAMQEAAKHYEGREVNVNHPDRRNAGAERRIEDGFGWLESITVKPDGVYGDLHYLKEHPVAGLVTEAAERNPKRFGLSHNAEGAVRRIDGKNVVESIERVISVDLVQNPATNAGLFESEQKSIREVLAEHAPQALAQLLEDGALLPPEAMDEPMAPQAGPATDGKATAKAALVQLLSAVVEMPGDIKSICVQLIDVCQKIIAGQPEPKDPEAEGELDENGEPKKPADPNADPAADDSADPKAGGAAEEDPFTKRKKPMAESTPAVGKKTLEERISALEAENKELREMQELSQLKEHCTQLLIEHKREVTGPRLTALARADNDAARVELIEDWPIIPQPEQPAQRKQRPSFSAPLRESNDAKYPSDVKSFVEACR